MELVALKRLYRGRNGFVEEGQRFEEPVTLYARQLLREGKATLAYETKVIYPAASEVVAVRPFRHGDLPNN